jgi:uncharacterized membrane protein
MNDPNETILDYLAQLERAATVLPDEVRAELLADVRAHLEEVAHRDPRPAALLQAIDDLGTPATLVDAAHDELGPATAPQAPQAPSSSASAVPRVPGIGRELLAFVLTVPGPVIALILARLMGGTTGASPALLILPPLVVLLTGWALVWTSRWWEAGDKALATAIWPFGYALPLIVGTLPTQSCVSDGSGREICEGFALPPALGIPLLLVLVAVPLAGTVWLFARAQRRARAAGRPTTPTVTTH